MLCEVFVGALWMYKPMACWEHLGRLIRQSPKIEHIHVEPGYEIINPREQGQWSRQRREFAIDQNTLESIQLCPVWRKLEKKFGLDQSENQSGSNAVKMLVPALEFAGDRLDVIHAMISKVDTNVLASALQVVERRQQKRKARNAKAPVKKAKRLEWKALRRICVAHTVVCLATRKLRKTE